MGIYNLLCDDICSFCGNQLKQISGKFNVFYKCIYCKALKTIGIIYDEKHNRYHEVGEPDDTR